MEIALSILCFLQFNRNLKHKGIYLIWLGQFQYLDPDIAYQYILGNKISKTIFNLLTRNHIAKVQIQMYLQ